MPKDLARPETEIMEQAVSVVDAVGAVGPGRELSPGLRHSHLLERHPALIAGTPDFVVDEAVVEAGIGGVVSRAREYDAGRARPVQRPQAHGARLAAAVDLATVQLEGAQRFAGVADRDDLGVGSRVVGGRHEVRARGQDLPISDHHRTERAAAPRGDVLGREGDRLGQESDRVIVRGHVAYIAGDTGKRQGSRTAR